MTRKLFSIVAIATLAITAPSTLVVAQSPAAARSSTPSAGPTMSSSTVGVRRTTAPAPSAPAAEARLGAGRNVALMVVGGAALIIGAVIGGTAGVLIAVTGAAIGLYGLYNFIQ